jgi:hypothetical protein
VPHAVLLEVFTDSGVGTMVLPDPRPTDIGTTAPPNASPTGVRPVMSLDGPPTGVGTTAPTDVAGGAA